MSSSFLVPKNYLMLTAGLVWTGAGFLVASTGFPLLAAEARQMWWLYPLSLAVFLTFYLLIFNPPGEAPHGTGPGLPRDPPPAVSVLR
ncbi:MAG: hypothetical protein Q4B08_05750 [Propionibacteriaceae bacterium]|nr:hypothetical protein [Propionibacteriaceae bacterium]